MNYPFQSISSPTQPSEADPQNQTPTPTLVVPDSNSHNWSQTCGAGPRPTAPDLVWLLLDLRLSLRLIPSPTQQADHPCTDFDHFSQIDLEFVQSDGLLAGGIRADPAGAGRPAGAAVGRGARGRGARRLVDGRRHGRDGRDASSVPPEARASAQRERGRYLVHFHI